MHETNDHGGALGARRSGPHLDRRALLRSAACTLGASALAAAALPALAHAGPAARTLAGDGDAGGDDGHGEALSYEEFLALAVPAARELLGYRTRFGEDRYLLMLAALAVRLDAVPVPELTRRSPEGQPGWYLGANDAPDDCPFTVLHWKLEPGGVVRHHPHTYGSVVTVGLEGETRITNYETVEAPDYDATGTFAVRRTQDQVLRAHDINLVPLMHGFVHGFVAGPEGARGLDITTRVMDKQPNLGMAVVTTLDEARALFEARWTRGS